MSRKSREIPGSAARSGYYPKEGHLMFKGSIAEIQTFGSHSGYYQNGHPMIKDLAVEVQDSGGRIWFCQLYFFFNSKVSKHDFMVTKGLK